MTEVQIELISRIVCGKTKTLRSKEEIDWHTMSKSYKDC